MNDTDMIDGDGLEEPLTLEEMVDVYNPESHAIREAWLVGLVGFLGSEVFLEYELPPVKVSCGWTGGRSMRTTRGTCWTRDQSNDGLNQIFISV